jgi:hypothetical protein
MSKWVRELSPKDLNYGDGRRMSHLQVRLHDK